MECKLITSLYMEYVISKDDLKILLLKCIGGKYPVKIVFDNDNFKTAFIRGFADAACSIIMVSNDSLSLIHEMKIDNVKRIETNYLITLDRLKGRIFNVI